PTALVLPPHAPWAARLAGAWARRDTAVMTWTRATIAEMPRIATSPSEGSHGDERRGEESTAVVTPARAGRDPTRPGRRRPRRCSGGIRATLPPDRAPPARPRTAGSIPAAP